MLRPAASQAIKMTNTGLILNAEQPPETNGGIDLPLAVNLRKHIGSRLSTASSKMVEKGEKLSQKIVQRDLEITV